MEEIERLANGIRDELGLSLAVMRLRGVTPEFELTVRAAFGAIKTRIQALTSEAQTLDVTPAEASAPDA